MKAKKIIVFLFGIFITFCCKAEVKTDELQQLLADRSMLQSSNIRFQKEVRNFYNYFHYKLAWINPGSSSALNSLFVSFTSSKNLGLAEKDYQFKFIVDFKTGFLHLNNSRDSMLVDIKITDAAIHFFSDIVDGNTKPVFGYNGLNYNPDCHNIALLLADHLNANKLTFLLKDIEPAFEEYKAFKNKIIEFNARISDPDFKEVKIKSQKINIDNKAFFIKLHQLGFLDSVNQILSAEELKKKIKKVQRLFSLMDDGVIRSTVIDEMNVPLATRIKQLNLSINYVRWLQCCTQNKSSVVLNIPSANLLVYQHGVITLESKVIVGKSSTHTPTLNSVINEVILYPYWQVPHKIAAKELLPLIKRNVNYFDEGNYDVLNQEGKRVNPKNVNWYSLSASYFPYTLRQSTGCDNSLGIVKFNFENPFSVYLHDTPVKGLFDMNKRYFSHGCMRVEKAIELAHLILKNNAVAIDTLTEKGCLLNQSPITVHADEPMQLFVIYTTAWYYEGEVKFFEDVYDKMNFLK